MPATSPGPEPAPLTGNLELRCCIRIRRTKVPKVFPELAFAAALRRLQQELILLRPRDAEVDGEVVAQVGSGAILGERAVLGDGRRTATLRAVRSSRVAVIAPDEISRPYLAEISALRTR